MTFPFLKGHGTRNDFVVLPDLDGSVHGDLDADLVRRLCDRRSGIGADGVLRVLRSEPGSEAATGGAAWFMDYRNADGSVSEMCGNGVRVFARYLAAAGLVDPERLDAERPLPVGTRDGVKSVVFCPDGHLSVDMGGPVVGAEVAVEVGGRMFAATAVDVGNPHAVVFVDSLGEAGTLFESPGFDDADFPNGVNVEFAARRGDGAIGVRVFERGVGETQSCGTGACAVAAAARERWSDVKLPYDDDGGGSVDGHTASYRIEVPGGALSVSFDKHGHAHLKGPAVLVAEGTWTG